MPAARRLNSYSRQHKLLLISFVVFLFVIFVLLPSLVLVEMEVARQRALVRAAAPRKKQKKRKEGASSSAPKVTEKRAPKRKANEKDDRPSKKVIVTPGEKHPTKSSHPKPSYGAGKGLMTSSGLVTKGARHLLTHKGYTVEMVESIIKQTNVKPCVE